MISYLLIPALALALVLIAAYTAWRWEWKAFLPAAVLAAIPFFLNNSLDQALSLPMPLILGLFSGISIKKKYSLTAYLVTASMVTGAFLTGQYYYMKNVRNIDVLQQSRLVMEKRLTDAEISPDQKRKMSEDFKVFEEIMRDKMPFLSFLQALIFAALTFYAVKLFLQRLHKAEPGKGLEFFRLNDYFIFALITGLGVYLLIDSAKYPVIHLIGLNMTLIVVFLYVIQAMGIIKYFIKKRNMPRYLVWLMFLFLLLAGIPILPFLLIIMAGVGVLDLWADLRKLNTADKPES